MTTKYQNDTKENLYSKSKELIYDDLSMLQTALLTAGKLN